MGVVGVFLALGFQALCSMVSVVLSRGVCVCVCLYEKGRWGFGAFGFGLGFYFYSLRVLVLGIVEGLL